MNTPIFFIGYAFIVLLALIVYRMNPGSSLCGSALVLLIAGSLWSIVYLYLLPMLRPESYIPYAELLLLGYTALSVLGTYIFLKHRPFRGRAARISVAAVLVVLLVWTSIIVTAALSWWHYPTLVDLYALGAQ